MNFKAHVFGIYLTKPASNRITEYNKKQNRLKLKIK